MLFTLFVYLHSQSHAKHAGNLKSSAQFQQSRFNTTKICHTISNGLMLIEHIEINYFFNPLYTIKWTSGKTLGESALFEPPHLIQIIFRNILK